MATFRVRSSASGSQEVGVVGRLFRSLFFLVFAGMGIVITVLFARSMARGMVAWTWERAECRVLTAQVEDLLFTLPPEEGAKESSPYRLAATFEWQRDGRTYTGSNVGGRSQFGSRGRAERELARYGAGSVVPCYLNPQDPAAASLRRPRPWSLLVLVFPLIFVGFGVAGIVATWSGGWRRAGRGASGVAAPRSQPRSKQASRGCMVAGFSLFAIFGGAFLLFFAVPLARKLGSADWQRVPATVVWSGVGEHSGDDGSTYSVDVLYEYEHGGRRYRANRHRFMGGSSSGRESKQEVVAAMPAGARVDAWVDPDDPSSAVLDRALGPFIWFALLPLVFVAVGVGGMIGAARSGRKRRAGVEWLPEAEGGDAVAGASAAGVAAADQRAGQTGTRDGGLPPAPVGPVRLEPAKSRVGAFVGLLLFSVIWNGIVGVAGWALWSKGEIGSNGCATAFVGVFALIGLLMLSALPGKFLALWNPRAVIELSLPPAPGVPVALSWRFLGAAGRLQRLTIRLEGREEATYRRGTDSVTERRVFARHVLVDTTDRGQVAAGETLLALPADTMHSFTAPHNKVVWSLKLHGTIERWPDVDDEVAILVYPAALVAEG